MIKGTRYLVFFLILFLGCNKDTTEDRPPGTCNFIDFKYYRDAKDYLGELSTNYIQVAFDTLYTDTEIRKFISSTKDFDQNYKYTLYNSKVAALRLNTTKTCEEISDLIFTLKKNPIIEYVHYTMKTNDCMNWIWQPIGNLCVNSYSSVFYVEVFDANKLTDLQKMMAETKTELLEQNPFMSSWFILKTTKKSIGDALKMANYFYESKLFVTAEPDIIKFPVE